MKKTIRFLITGVGGQGTILASARYRGSRRRS